MTTRRSLTLTLLTGLVLLSACVGDSRQFPKDQWPTVEGNRVKMVYDDRFQSWTATVDVDRWDLLPGDQVDYSFKFDAELPALRAHREDWDNLVVVLWGERVFDEDGRYTQQSNIGLSSFLTPGGLPVENQQWIPIASKLGTHFGSPVEGLRTVMPEDIAWDDDRATFLAPIQAEVSSDCPPGYYRFHVRVLVRMADSDAIVDLPHTSWMWDFRKFGTDDWPYTRELLDTWRELFAHFFITALPEMRVGNPAPPRLVAAVSFGEVLNGVRGILSAEDRRSVGLSRRTKFNDLLTMPPGRRKLGIAPVAFCPQMAFAESQSGGDMAQAEQPHYMRFDRGDLDFTLSGPGDLKERGRGVRLVGLRDGTFLTDPPLEFDLARFGRYELWLEGRTQDTIGREYHFGGRYAFWIAEPLSFSTAAKVGTSFFPGDRYPAKVQIHPPLPAYVRMRVRHFTGGAGATVRDGEFEGYANEFGYFVPESGSRPFSFDEPGEYRADFTAAYVEDDGRLWLGAQTAAGVVADPNPEVILHGAKVNYLDLKIDQPQLGLMARYAFPHEFANGMLDDCVPPDNHDVLLPYLSGDVLFLPTKLDSSNALSPLMTQEIRDGAVRRRFLDLFREKPPFCPHVRFGVRSRNNFFAEVLKFAPYSDVYYSLDPDSEIRQLPVLSLHDRGWSPYNFPEGVSVRNYYYFAAIRPGFPAFSIVEDSLDTLPYWAPSSNPFGRQINAGPNGDLPDDVYRIDAGLVHDDLRTGRTSYSAYAATISMVPSGHGHRVEGPGERPLLTIAGRDYPLFLAIEAGAVLHPGEKLALASMVFPPVPAKVSMELTAPDGTVHSASGTANAIGVFNDPNGSRVLREPGVYAVRATTEYQGRHGGVVYTPDDTYYHFVVPRNRPRLIRLEGPPVRELDPAVDTVLSFVVDPELRNARIYWSIACPGIVMDVGRVKLDSSRFQYRFMPSDFAVEFRNYQVVDYDTGKKTMAKSTFLLFYVEGEDAQGRRVQDVAMLMTRGMRMFDVSGRKAENNASRDAARAAFPDATPMR